MDRKAVRLLPLVLIAAVGVAVVGVAVFGPFGSSAADDRPKGSVTSTDGAGELPEDIAAAIDFRVKNGLRADRAHVESVVHDPRAVDYWAVPLLPEESDDLLSRGERITPVIDAIQSTINADPSFAGIYIDNSTGGTVRIGTTGDVATLQQKLAPFSTQDVPIVVYAAEHSQQSLDTLQKRVIGDLEGWRTEGVEIVTIGVDVIANRLEVGVVNLRPEDSARLIARYGEAISVVDTEQPTLLLD